ncbi:putative oligomycin resistance ATP-dependent permease YOR1 [Phytophthora infestans]|uniref:Putative oligomycin resistance ATP-dependent permease YOR1 n=1 Tax=Phytophthora infestans TaxID=4787 RepID=A0A833T794_PHYIN|nr:putative oligomycin resistance ATP-dependent permease YOR1 [Phytophthora infestans]KAF4148609.1 putative oligomycin resistance ATP-dependent permease YOR1 [Phytophthora infestans]
MARRVRITAAAQPKRDDMHQHHVRTAVRRRQGLNFSSSQRTRVVIARAVYQAVNIYLLEAVLSAVDSHVGTNIFKACFKKSLKGKLVLLVAHSLSFVSHCDQIVVIADGRIT